MSDLERLLKSSLEEVGGDFEPKDSHVARQRFLAARRRRRITAFVSGLAVAGVTIAGIVFVASPKVTTPEDRPLPGPEVAAEVGALSIAEMIPVGVDPIGLTVDTDGGVWVANNGDSSVSLFAPGAKEIETISLESPPEDVAATESFVYAVDGPRGAPESLTGSATVIDRASARLASRKGLDDIPDGDRAQLFAGTLLEGADGNLGHIDVAASGNGLWAATAEGKGVFVTLDDGTTQGFDVASTGEVATLDGIGFALDTLSRSVFRLDTANRTPEILPLPDEVQIKGSSNLDMVGGLGSLWLAQDGVLYRLDPETAALTASTELDGGDYAALATGEGYLWVLEANVDPTLGGSLYKVDPDTGDIVGAPLDLDGRLADVAAGGGSVWVTSRSAGALLRIDISGS